MSDVKGCVSSQVHCVKKKKVCVLSLKLVNPISLGLLEHVQELGGSRFPCSVFHIGEGGEGYIVPPKYLGAGWG